MKPMSFQMDANGRMVIPLAGERSPGHDLPWVQVRGTLTIELAQAMNWLREWALELRAGRYITTEEAARRLCMVPQSVVQACQQGRLEGIRGRTAGWFRRRPCGPTQASAG